MFDWKKPTVQMLGRWQPWHQGHQELFKRCVAKTGQVVIQVRDVQGASGGQDQDDNPFDCHARGRSPLPPRPEPRMPVTPGRSEEGR